jgi:predicted RecB family nuclease
MKQSLPKDLLQIPGVGKSIAEVLQSIGIQRADDLRGKNPEQLYQRLCNFNASPVDKCMLYVLRCAIYYTENTEHDPELLKWWRWRDKV